MKPFNFSSPYSRLGMFFAMAACACAATFSLLQEPEPVPFRFSFESSAKVEHDRLPWKLVEPPHMDFGDFNPDASDIPNFRDPARFFNSEAKAPCFSVFIDPTVPGGTEDHYSGVFGGSDLVVSTEAFTDGLKEKMAEEFSAEAWARDPNCFDGSFVVTFTVAEDGSIGDDMLVHHLRGTSNQAGISVLDVLRSMDRFGHRWHDGTKGTGEVRIPVKFKLG